jgi:putative ABC transport system substrate-binding protein
MRCLHSIRDGAFLVLLLLACVSHRALAQEGAKVLHVGILSSGSRDVRAPLDLALVEGLRTRGYVEGKNLVIERRYGSSNIDENAKQLAAMKLDAILTTCSPSTRVMSDATSTTPIVMAAVSDPVRQGLIASLSKPGRNVTGTSSQAEELLVKRLELMVTMLPKATRIGVLANARNPVHELGWQRLEAAAREKNIRLVKVAVSRRDDVAAALESTLPGKVDALFVLPDDPMMLNARFTILDFAERRRLPDFHWAREFTEAGGLMSYGENLRRSYAAAAAYMDRIKGGANPATLPVEQAARFELVLNLKRAQALGVALPQQVLLQADEVLQ